jgi:hypothetical protein
MRREMRFSFQTLGQAILPKPTWGPYPAKISLKLVPGGGIEPPQSFWDLRILSPLRLPISPSRQFVQVIHSK